MLIAPMAPRCPVQSLSNSNATMWLGAQIGNKNTVLSVEGSVHTCTAGKRDGQGLVQAARRSIAQSDVPTVGLHKDRRRNDNGHVALVAVLVRRPQLLGRCFCYVHAFLRPRAESTITAILTGARE